MESIACNVVILPTQIIADRAITISHNLSEKRTLFTLEDGVFYPHVSIYMVQFKIVDIPQVERLLHKLAKNTESIQLISSKYSQAMNFLDVEYEKPVALSGLQDGVLAVLNPIRDGMRGKDKIRMQEASGLALKNFQQYGWQSIGQLYRPHMTITRFTHDQSLAELPLPNVAEFNGMFSKLGLFEMGENGTCVRKISEFEFGK